MASLRALDKWRSHAMLKPTFTQKLPGFTYALGLFAGYVVYDAANPDSHGHTAAHNWKKVLFSSKEHVAPAAPGESEVFGVGPASVPHKYVKENGEIVLKEA